MKPYLWAILTALTWGCVPILEKMGLGKIAVFPGLFYRSVGVLLGALILLSVKFSQIKDVFVSHPINGVYLILGGFLASFIGQLFFYHALKEGEASQVVPLAATYPLVSFILGVIFLSEKLTVMKAGGIAAIIIGIILLK